MKLRRRYIPFLSKIFDNVNQDIGKYGVQKAFHKIIIRNGIRIELIGLTPKIINILQSKRVILVSNHPHEIEPFILLANLPPRKNVFVIANTMFMNWLSNLNKYIIPVHVRHRLGKKERFRFRARLFWMLPLANKSIPYQIAHQENIQNIKNASLKIDQGAMIIIFPGMEQKEWFKGVGYLLKNTITKDTIYFVKVRIRGTTKLDLLRIIPGIFKLFPQIKIEFAPAIKINKFRDYSGKEITSKLETDYRKWIS